MDENSNTPSASGAPEPQQPAPQPEAVPQQPAPQPEAAPENPFAAFGTSAPQPEAAPAPAAVSPEVARPASAATAPTQPYYDAAAAQPAQQPYAPYGQAAGAGQPYASYAQAAAQQPTYAPYDAAGYGTYGAGNQPPVPPAPAQNIYPGYEPPNPNQKRRWPWFLLGLVVGLVIGMGGCASCVGIMALADYDSSYDSYNSYDDGYDYNYGLRLRRHRHVGSRGQLRYRRGRLALRRLHPRRDRLGVRGRRRRGGRAGRGRLSELSHERGRVQGVLSGPARRREGRQPRI